MQEKASYAIPCFFYTDNYYLRCEKVQSKEEKQIPQAANCPPNMGARSFTRAIPAKARLLNPFGAFRAPLIIYEKAKLLAI